MRAMSFPMACRTLAFFVVGGAVGRVTSTIARVISTSAREGEGSPEGSLCSRNVPSLTR